MKKENKISATERIKILFGLAKDNKSKQKRYIELAEKIGQKMRTKIPKELKLKYCKHCKTLFNAETLKVRTKNGIIIYECLECGDKDRIPLQKSQ